MFLKTTLLSILVFTSGTQPVDPTRSKIPPSVLNNLHKSVTTAIVFDAEGEVEGYGTIWAYSRTLMITAEHVCDVYDRGGKIGVENGAYVTYSLKPIYREPKMDLCVLDGNPGMIPLRLRNYRAFEGERVWLFGSPMGVGKVVTEGFAGPMARLTNLNDLVCQQFSLLAWGGNSGGPILDKEGMVVGMLVAGVRRYPVVSFAIPGDIMKRSLDAEDI